MILRIQNLKVKYGNQTALEIDSPITINEGERLGIIGSNGAGKTTLVKSVLGLTDYTGSIHTELMPEQMAVHMQHNHYVDTMSVKAVMEAVLDTKINGNAELMELIDYFEFEGCLRKKYKQLSGGQKQRMTIIMVMLQNAPLTFYDEVTSGLDFETRQRLMEKLASWYAKRRDNALCIVSHYYEELEMLADKILILDQGKVVDFGDKKELFRKHCGKSIMVVDNTPDNQALLKTFPKLAAPAHLIALPCRSMEDELKLTKLFVSENLNFKRSNSDIEIMSINAKETCRMNVC